jgi:hypothetical protein
MAFAFYAISQFYGARDAVKHDDCTHISFDDRLGHIYNVEANYQVDTEIFNQEALMNEDGVLESPNRLDVVGVWHDLGQARVDYHGEKHVYVQAPKYALANRHVKEYFHTEHVMERLRNAFSSIGHDFSNVTLLSAPTLQASLFLIHGLPHLRELRVHSIAIDSDEEPTPISGSSDKRCNQYHWSRQAHDALHVVDKLSANGRRAFVTITEDVKLDTKKQELVASATQVMRNLSTLDVRISNLLYLSSTGAVPLCHIIACCNPSALQRFVCNDPYSYVRGDGHVGLTEALQKEKCWQTLLTLSVTEQFDESIFTHDRFPVLVRSSSFDTTMDLVGDQAKQYLLYPIVSSERLAKGSSAMDSNKATRNYVTMKGIKELFWVAPGQPRSPGSALPTVTALDIVLTPRDTQAFMNLCKITVGKYVANKETQAAKQQLINTFRLFAIDILGSRFPNMLRGTFGRVHLFYYFTPRSQDPELRPNEDFEVELAVSGAFMLGMAALFDESTSVQFHAVRAPPLDRAQCQRWIQLDYYKRAEYLDDEFVSDADALDRGFEDSPYVEESERDATLFLFKAIYESATTLIKAADKKSRKLTKLVLDKEATVLLETLEHVLGVV